ncbi:hypothetical protein GCM10010425_59300 [Streptomyces spororaveus]|uniref:Uncharacterized protein n=1 Tax=Streptomyces spororaveus TaxID=284039 RepID=A0ABQ3T735_9ACTN|nr:hypothetical protein Sspor_17600 [Streptomyces spororaveus]
MLDAEGLALGCPDSSPKGEVEPAAVLPEHPDMAKEAATVKPVAMVRMRM